VEAGSNIGAHTVGLAKAVTPAGCVVAVEPQPDIFRVLCANLALNGVSNVTPFAVGCGKTERTMIVPLYDYRAEADHNSGGVALTASGAGVPVAVAPLDELIGAIPRLDLLKVDVEGMEKEALEGAQRLIERYRPVLYVENDRVEKSGDLIEFIRGLGYRLWWHMPPLFNPDNFFGVDSNAYANIVSFNMVCQPKERSTQTFVGLQEIDGSGYHPRSTGRSA
jgi:FkbM family methyltransferase